MNFLSVKFVVQLFILCNLAIVARAVTKIWKHDIDVHNPANWAGGKAKDDCSGLTFETSNTDIPIDRLDIKQVSFLGRASLQLLDGAVIKFDEDSQDVMNCVTVNVSSLFHWSDPKNWIIQGDNENAAIPHKERLPCEHDDVVFPKGWKSAPCFVIVLDSYIVRSFKFGDDILTSKDIKQMESAPITLFHPLLNILVTNKDCTDASGCACANEGAAAYVCDWMGDDGDQSARCLNSIIPIGHCYGICGVNILFRYTGEFSIDRIRDMLKEYSSDTYVSKVNNDTDYFSNVERIQIVFTEKDFTGTSLNEGKHFYSLLLSDHSLGAKSVEFYTSSEPLPKDSSSTSAISVVFGSLCGVVVFFVVILFLYSPQDTVVRLRDRLRFTSFNRPLSSFNRNLFAKFENTENAGLIIGETESLTGSVLSLDKSFDNPMYGKPSPPSTASTSDTMASGDIRITTAEIAVENPLYDISNMADDAEDVAEEGELIDLKKTEE